MLVRAWREVMRTTLMPQPAALLPDSVQAAAEMIGEKLLGF